MTSLERSRCKILRILRSDIPKASACLAAERCGDLVRACLTVLMVSGVCTLRGLPGDFRFNAEEVCRKLRIQNDMVFCLTLFRAGLRQNECETGAEQQSRNHHI